MGRVWYANGPGKCPYCPTNSAVERTANDKPCSVHKRKFKGGRSQPSMIKSPTGWMPLGRTKRDDPDDWNHRSGPVRGDTVMSALNKCRLRSKAMQKRYDEAKSLRKNVTPKHNVDSDGDAWVRRRRRLNHPKTHAVVLERLLEEIQHLS